MSDLGRDLGQWLGRGIIETTEDLADAFVSPCSSSVPVCPNKQPGR